MSRHNDNIIQNGQNEDSKSLSYPSINHLTNNDFYFESLVKSMKESSFIENRKVYDKIKEYLSQYDPNTAISDSIMKTSVENSSPNYEECETERENLVSHESFATDSPNYSAYSSPIWNDPEMSKEFSGDFPDENNMDDCIAILSSPERGEPEVIDLSDSEIEKSLETPIHIPKNDQVQRSRKKSRSSYNKITKMYDLYQSISEKTNFFQSNEEFSNNGRKNLANANPVPGSLGELLLKNQAKQIAQKNENQEHDILNSDEEEELELKRIALQSVVENLDRNKLNSQSQITEENENLLSSMELEVLEQEIKEPVDMEICESEPENEEKCSQEEIDEVGDNFNIPVEWAFMIPPPATQDHANDLENFEDFSRRQNLCMQTLEMSSSSQVQDCSSSVSLLNNNQMNSTYNDADSYSSHQVFPDNKQYIPNIETSGTFEYESYCDTLNQTNALNQQAFMTALTSGKRSNLPNTNLIQIQPITASPKKLSRRSRKRKRALSRQNRKKKFTKVNNSFGAKLANPVQKSKPQVPVIMDASMEEDEVGLRNKLLNDLAIRAMEPKTSTENVSLTANISSKATSNDDKTAPILGSQQFTVGTKKFTYPKPIVINLNAESSSDESEPNSYKNEIISSNISSQITHFLKDVRNHTQPQALSHLSRRDQAEYSQMKLRLQELEKKKTQKLDAMKKLYTVSDLREVVTRKPSNREYFESCINTKEDLRKYLNRPRHCTVPVDEKPENISLLSPSNDFEDQSILIPNKENVILNPNVFSNENQETLLKIRSEIKHCLEEDGQETKNSDSNESLSNSSDSSVSSNSSSSEDSDDDTSNDENSGYAVNLSCKENIDPRAESESSVNNNQLNSNSCHLSSNVDIPQGIGMKETPSLLNEVESFRNPAESVLNPTSEEIGTENSSHPDLHNDSNSFFILDPNPASLKETDKHFGSETCTEQSTNIEMNEGHTEDSSARTKETDDFVKKLTNACEDSTIDTNRDTVGCTTEINSSVGDSTAEKSKEVAEESNIGINEKAAAGLEGCKDEGQSTSEPLVPSNPDSKASPLSLSAKTTSSRKSTQEESLKNKQALERVREASEKARLRHFEVMLHKRRSALLTSRLQMKMHRQRLAKIDSEGKHFLQSMQKLKKQLQLMEKQYKMQADLRMKINKECNALQISIASDTRTLGNIQKVVLNMGRTNYGNSYKLSTVPSTSKTVSPALKNKATAFLRPQARLKPIEIAITESNVLSSQDKDWKRAGVVHLPVWSSDAIQKDTKVPVTETPTAPNLNKKADKSAEETPESKEALLRRRLLARRKQVVPRVTAAIGVGEISSANIGRRATGSKGPVTANEKSASSCKEIKEDSPIPEERTLSKLIDDESSSSIKESEGVLCPHDLLGTCSDTNCSLTHSSSLKPGMASVSKSTITAVDFSPSLERHSDDSGISSSVAESSVLVDSNTKTSEANSGLDLTMNSPLSSTEPSVSSATVDQNDQMNSSSIIRRGIEEMMSSKKESNMEGSVSVNSPTEFNITDVTSGSLSDSDDSSSSESGDSSSESDDDDDDDSSSCDSDTAPSDTETEKDKLEFEVPPSKKNPVGDDMESMDVGENPSSELLEDDESRVTGGGAGDGGRQVFRL